MNWNEENETFASLLGWKQQADPTLKYFGYYISEDKKYKPSDLNFSTDWNMLMLAITACKESQLFGSQHLIDKIDEALLFVDIEATYKAVLEFIQWYNKQ